MDTISERLILLIKQYNLNKKKFAIELGISPSTVGNWIKGFSEPNSISLNQIAVKFNKVNLEWLLTGKGYMLNKEQSEAKELLHKYGNGTLEAERKEVNELQKKLIAKLEEIEKLKDDNHKLQEDIRLLKSQINK